MMKAHPGWVVLNRGIDGQRSDEILARFQRDVVQEAPDYVIVLAGVNDIYQGIPLKSIKRNILEMYASAVKAKIVPVAATVLPYNTASKSKASTIRQLNSWIRSTAKSLGIPFCDTSAAVASPSNPDRLQASPDGHHPDVACYRTMAMRLTEVIEKHALNVHTEAG
jgi:lysophospholipase L1-like esterase